MKMSEPMPPRDQELRGGDAIAALSCFLAGEAIVALTWPTNSITSRARSAGLRLHKPPPGHHLCGMTSNPMRRTGTIVALSAARSLIQPSDRGFVRVLNPGSSSHRPPVSGMRKPN
jgi:hypothetical protein